MEWFFHDRKTGNSFISTSFIEASGNSRGFFIAPDTFKYPYPRQPDTHLLKRNMIFPPTLFAF
jgi:hypothetical protein